MLVLKRASASRPSGEWNDDDFEVAEATYRAAVARWPAARITLRQDARVVERNWSTSAGAALPC